MSAPRWTRALLARLAEPDLVDEVVGDLEEAHARRIARRGRALATLLTSMEAVDMAFALRWNRRRVLRRLRGSVPADLPSARRRRTPPVSWLDLKLAVRMLRKHPALSLVSTIGMAVAVGIGATAFGVIRGMTASPLPLDQGDRVVTVQNIAAFGFEQMRATHLHSLRQWRDEVPALEELGAYRIITRNLIADDGRVAPARVVQMTASGFRIARVPPSRGRYLDEADEARGAPDVIVIGWGLWQDRFGGDPDVVGRTIRVGATPHTVVGVMPRDFAFPINNRAWTPLRLDPVDFQVGAAPPVDVFGRLAPDATLADASAQLAVVHERASTQFPDVYRRLSSGVFPYTQELFWGPGAWLLYLVQLFVSLILVVIAVNVAALVYARTMTRLGEIAVKTALGASRGRISAQLFAEGLLLSVTAAAVGLLAARFALEQIELSQRSSQGEQMPFWWSFDLSPEAFIYGFGLAVLAALIIGVVPALGATGRMLRARLQSAGAGGSGPALGRTWTALIVLQIAGAVAIIPVALGGVAAWISSADVPRTSFPLEEVLVARLDLDRDVQAGPNAVPPDAAARYAVLRDELVARLAAHPEVSHVALVGTPPPWLDPDIPFELDGPAAGPLAGTPDIMGSASTGHRVGHSSVSSELFATFDIPVIRGRAISAADASTGAPVAIVNETFVDLVVGGQDPIGRQIRFPTYTNPNLGPRSPTTSVGLPWYTIIGVIPDFPPPGRTIANPEAKVFLPLTADLDSGPVGLAVRVRNGNGTSFQSPLRMLTADLDPMLRLAELGTLESPEDSELALAILALTALALAVLLLAIAGLYALMSFTVARRHREIGIRTALGAGPRRLLASILSRAAWQLALGTAAGLALSGWVDRLAGGEILGGRMTFLLPAVAALMVIVGVMAAWGPARRGLAIEPTEALRAE